MLPGITTRLVNPQSLLVFMGVILFSVSLVLTVQSHLALISCRERGSSSGYSLTSQAPCQVGQLGKGDLEEAGCSA